MRILILLLSLVSFTVFGETLSFNVNDFEAKTFNVVSETTLTKTPIIQIDVDTEKYITFRGVYDGKQIGKTLIILESYITDSEYYFICENNKTHTIHSLTLNLFNKLIMLDNDDDFIEIYYLDLKY